MKKETTQTPKIKSEEEQIEDVIKNFEIHFSEQYTANDWRRLKSVRVQEPLSWLREVIGDLVSSILKERDEKIQNDINSVLNMLEGETDREQIVNFIKEYLKQTK